MGYYISEDGIGMLSVAVEKGERCDATLVEALLSELEFARGMALKAGVGRSELGIVSEAYAEQLERAVP